MISRKGEISTANYDHLGRKTSLSIPNMGTYSYEYNIMGQAVKVSHGSEAIRYIYDDLGRVVRETDGAGRHMDYAYNDAAGTWDVKYNVTNSSHYWLRYATDDAGRLSSIKEYGTNTLATYRYDTLSRVKSVAFGNGTVKNVTYEASGHLKSLKHNFTGTADDATWLYGRNNNGQVTSKNISNAGYQWTPSFTSNTLYSANALNQYYNIGGIEQKHDKNGNLIQDGSMSFIFNALGQMTEAKSGGMIVGKYEYDPLGRRKAKTAGGLKTEYLWSGNQVMAEYRGGKLLRRYIYGAGIDNPIALVAGNGTKTYIHKDALGSVVALSNNAGVVTDKFSYSPFGKSADESGSPYKFAARWIDSETGLYYNRNRYYNPSTGRFISPDPIGYGDGMNMYAYVGNDPMNATDPMGLAKKSKWTRCFVPGRGMMSCVTVIGQRLLWVISIGAANGASSSRKNIKQEKPPKDEKEEQDEQEDCTPSKSYTGSLKGLLEINFPDMTDSKTGINWGAVTDPQVQALNRTAYTQGFREYLGSSVGGSAIQNLRYRQSSLIINIVPYHPDGGSAIIGQPSITVPIISEMYSPMTTAGKLPHTPGDLIAHEIGHALFKIQNHKDVFKKHDNPYRQDKCIAKRIK